MHTKTRTSIRVWTLFALTLFLTQVFACSHLVAKFNNQYKCQVPGKPDPRTPYEFVERGMEHIRADEFDCALGACSEAIRQDPRLATAYACRGGVLNGQGEYLKAIKDFDLALKLQPENGDFYYSRAQDYERLGEMDLAMPDLDKAVKLISSEFGRSVAFALRGRIHRKQGSFDEALRDYSQAIRLAPNFAYHYENRGQVYSEKKDYQRAVGDYSEAIKLDAQNAGFYRDRAEVYRAIGQNDLATHDEATADTLQGKRE